MKIGLSATLAMAGLLVAGSVFAAQAPAKTLTPQQQRMKDCNGQAVGKKGDERRSFMSSCLKGGAVATASASPKPATQREKTKACNADAKAKELRGDARKTFIGTCLKGEVASAH